MLWVTEELVRNSWTSETAVQQVWHGVGLERAKEPAIHAFVES